METRLQVSCFDLLILKGFFLYINIELICLLSIMFDLEIYRIIRSGDLLYFGKNSKLSIV